MNAVTKAEPKYVRHQEVHDLHVAGLVVIPSSIQYNVLCDRLELVEIQIEQLKSNKVRIPAQLLVKDGANNFALITAAAKAVEARKSLTKQLQAIADQLVVDLARTDLQLCDAIRLPFPKHLGSDDGKIEFHEESAK